MYTYIFEWNILCNRLVSDLKEEISVYVIFFYFSSEKTLI